jgi:hypothetical protein
MEPQYSTREEAEQMADVFWPGCRNGNTWTVKI